MTVAVHHALYGCLEPVRDPLSGHVLAFAEDDLAAAVATLLANGGFVATRLARVPEGEPIQIVGSEEEALVVVQLLLAELRRHRGRASAAATFN